MEFIVSEESIKKSFIGLLEHINYQIYDFKHLKDRLLNGKYEIINLDFQPTELCSIKDNYLVTINNTNNSISIFDQDLSLTQIIYKIDNKKFNPTGIAYNYNENKIYLSDCSNHRIIMTDIKFNMLNTFGSYGSNYNQLNCPNGICFKNKHLYVCDAENKRIQILTDNIQHYKFVYLNYRPYTIKASYNNIICIKAYDGHDIYFYDLNLSCVKYIQTIFSYSNLISEINSDLYYFTFSTLIWLNSDTMKNNETILTRFKNINSFFSICYFNNFIVIAANDKLLVKIQVE